MNEVLPFFATVPKNMESFLVEELESLGAQEVKETRAGASFSGSWELAYRVCLWSRIANRVLFPFARFSAETPEELYEGIRAIRWEDHVKNSGTLAVDFHSSRSAIKHTKYGALKVKDGIVDYFRDKTGVRPSVEFKTPDLRVNIFLMNDEARVCIDLSGESLHRRGYRIDGAHAPLKENLAAAILIKSGWREIAQEGGGLLDPMCGSGTLPIEAAMIAADSAPGLLRPYFGFLKWEQHQTRIWENLLEEAEEREREGFNKIPPIVGYDSDAAAVQIAFRNLERVGMTGMVHFEKKQLADCVPPSKARSQPGLVIVNPPYGERLGKVYELKSLYAALGKQLKTQFSGWRAGMLTGNPDLGKSMGLRAVQKRAFFNGTIPCELLQFEVVPEFFVNEEHILFKKPEGVAIRSQIVPLAEPFANRIKKNRRKLKSWLKRESISAYRIYDQDLPEFAVAIDIYEQWVHVQEYEAPSTVNPQKAQERLQALMDALPLVLEFPPENIFLKVRRKQKGAFQYEKYGTDQKLFPVREYGCQFLVNFTDYLDTGLFIDHRLTRKLIGEMAQGKRFLNLFSYTGSSTVYAALGGAVSTTSVDMSRHYLAWTKKNLLLNGISLHDHHLIEANCLEWVESEKRQYDLIFLDPPTFSNSKKMAGTFDVQRDHGPLIQSVMRLLAPEGILLFSNNFQKFKLDPAIASDFQTENWTPRTIPPDFQRKARIHQCWKITRQ
ncbi:MAG: bifunctional 23S rRNA (guanine(2069)-N(7))-methyltransferase RlmK/23S rRNA (guanine(2445)-N(2))-methyltransferase RlmL [SAR324 cluster bacterium]|nr:bifunctional 23S rRNA (guanine(2069)-N(7))-methyltransferase RlmK/23S rRNA (guanine(2445)-N(2))-methyltransferase RlmL [SAR324 cluster bacterium]